MLIEKRVDREIVIFALKITGFQALQGALGAIFHPETRVIF